MSKPDNPNFLLGYISLGQTLKELRKLDPKKVSQVSQWLKQSKKIKTL